ncbi:thiamine diphosphokinase [Tenuibacillus multivorans]|uniref:Thiamine diphosphokinase n=1 Tax=Tenuibacillus multivorans TaxID=237069 RepID=A0A1G9Y421_9BACI|nr:thiamine diphosphokinase [Tenuibacillus multivorans]GEL75921.1 thiamine pyrophosphokinase [Tenuibacillus multivorans]SDN03243.1 thiamine pyrophosphokinase [Tenuibacillus multivorans]
MEKMIGIVGAGPQAEIPNLSHYQQINFWIGVDRGVDVLLNSNITPDLVIGDFDSISEERLSEIKQDSQKVKVYPSVKDETDLELAFIETIQLSPKKVFVFGATGGRLDHEWMNIHLLKHFAEKNIDVWLVNHQNELTMKYPGKYALLKDESLPYISFLPFSQTVEGLTLNGFRYTLEDHTITNDSTLTVSNEWSEKKGTYLFKSGILLVIKSRD